MDCDDSSEMSITPPAMGLSKDSKPTEEMTSVVAPAGAVKLKFPVSSVEVPTLVPFTRMVALETGAPALSTTFPVTVLL